MNPQNQHLRGNRNNTRWFMVIHRRLIKPPYPTMIHCPNCGGPVIVVNSDMIEVVNSPGAAHRDLIAKDIWQKIKHYKCGAMITMYWKN